VAEAYAAATPRSASRSAARQGRCWPRKGRRKREGAGKRGARAAAAASGQGSLWRVCVRWLQPSAPRRPRTALKPNGVRPYASGSWPRRTDAPAWTGQTPRQADSAEFGAGDGGLQGRDIGGASLCSTTGSSCTAAQLTVVCAYVPAHRVSQGAPLSLACRWLTTPTLRVLRRCVAPPTQSKRPHTQRGRPLQCRQGRTRMDEGAAMCTLHAVVVLCFGCWQGLANRSMRIQDLYVGPVPIPRFIKEYSYSLFGSSLVCRAF
jgi:hypothetical protein